MAIKQRVLERIQAVGKEIRTVLENGNPVSLETALLELEDVRELCHSGLPQNFGAVYDEVFDGTIAAMRTLLADETKDSPVEVLLLCNELLQDVAVNLAKESHFKKEIVFLPYKASMWDSMESVWQAAVDDPEHAVPYVVVIPYCDRDPEGGAREWHCEAPEFPEYVPVVDYRRIDLKAMHPDVIVIQNPYDDYNTVTSVDMKYYSRYLREQTDKLVYIPYFILEEIDPDDEEALEGIAHFLFHGEAVRNAHLTIVQSENMREAYLRLLVRYSDKDRAYWEKRISGLGSPKIDKVLSTKREDIRLPESWRRVIEKHDGTRKTVILYNVSLTVLYEYQEELLDKMEWVFQTFRERQDETALLWRPHPLFEAMIKSRVPEVWERYRKMVERYRNEGWGIYDDSSDLHRAIAVSDGYYGDRSSLVELYRAVKKPVMLQSVNAQETLFGESL